MNERLRVSIAAGASHAFLFCARWPLRLLAATGPAYQTAPRSSYAPTSPTPMPRPPD